MKPAKLTILTATMLLVLPPLGFGKEPASQPDNVQSRWISVQFGNRKSKRNKGNGQKSSGSRNNNNRNSGSSTKKNSSQNRNIGSSSSNSNQSNDNRLGRSNRSNNSQSRFSKNIRNSIGSRNKSGGQSFSSGNKSNNNHSGDRKHGNKHNFGSGHSNQKNNHSSHGNWWRDRHDYQANANNNWRGSSRGNQYYSHSVIGHMLNTHPHASHVLPRVRRWNNGTYFHDQGHYYYYPQSTAVVSQPVVSADPQEPVQQEPVEIEFGGYVHIEELSQIMPLAVNDLCLDMHYNYAHNPGHLPAYRAAFGMLNTVKGMRQSFESDDRNSVADQLVEAERVLYEVAAQTEGWTRQQKQQIGETELFTKYEIVGDMMNHAFYDVGIEAVDETTEDPHSAATEEVLQEQAPPPPAE